jgi:hypothetical protein
METASHKTGITALASEQAPFVYFDGVVGLGTNHRAVQLELAARTVVPNGEGGVESKIVVACHIRCSLHAAASLRMPSIRSCPRQSELLARTIRNGSLTH